MIRGNKKVVLIAGIGTAPAVLTETVWALANGENAIIPDEILVITTKRGKKMLCNEILGGDEAVWKRMLRDLKANNIDVGKKLIFGEASIRVIPDSCGNEAIDLRSGDDNLCAADFMLNQLRQYTESSDTIVLASIAGGRKTMSALLFSCMTLLGREEDKVFHVLLPPEYEGGVKPPRYYPKRGEISENMVTGKRYECDKYNSELFEVPFVRMRGWYQDKFNLNPPGYRTLVASLQNATPRAIVYPKIEIDAWNGYVKLNGKEVRLSKSCFALLLLLSSGINPTVAILWEKLHYLHSVKNASHCDWLSTFQEGSRFKGGEFEDRTEVAKVRNELRKAMKRAGFENVDSLVPSANGHMTFPVRQIKIANKEKLADICGCQIFDNNRKAMIK